MKLKQQIEQHPAVAFVDDERSLGNGIIVTLKDDYDFSVDPGCGVRGYDTFGEALREIKQSARVAP